MQDNENKSPVYHEEHSLGLASWCVQPLFCYASGRLLDLRRTDHRREEPTTISRWLIGALLLNPDVSTFWNMKREMVRNGRLDALSELRFSTIVLFYKAKCFEAFAYRRWLIQYLLVGQKSSNLDVQKLLDNEIKVSDISADRYANNYHAWSHREYVVARYEKNLPDNYERFLKNEWDNSGKWCNRHVSDHSGLAYRQFLLKLLLFQRKTEKSDNFVGKEELKERRDFVNKLITCSVPNEDSSLELTNDDSWEIMNILHNTKTERRPEIDYDRVLIALSYWMEDCQNNENNILKFPGHESLWCHRRFLAYVLIVLNNSYRRENCYQVESLAGHWPRLEMENEETDSKEEDEKKCLDGQRKRLGLLVQTFVKDNERIVTLSQMFKCEPQSTLSEKFVKYMREFNVDLLGDEVR